MFNGNDMGGCYFYIECILDLQQTLGIGYTSKVGEHIPSSIYIYNMIFIQIRMLYFN